MQQLDLLDNALLDILSHEPISEFELIKKLQNEPYSLLDKDALQTPLLVFHTHFLIFNRLYKLKETLEQTECKTLSIHTLEIFFKDAPTFSGTHSQNNHPGEPVTGDDKLAEYYGNWENLKSVDHKQVDELLEQFWTRFKAYTSLNATSTFADRIEWAQAIFGINDRKANSSAFDKKWLKARYKREANSCHPDKGGDQERFKDLTKAYNILRNELLGR